MPNDLQGINYEYFGAHAEPSHAYLKPIVDQMLGRLAPGSVVLDLGCGNGSFLGLYRGKGWKLVGTDFSPTGIAHATANYPDIDFILSDAQHPNERISSLANRVDAILSTETIEHIYAPRDFLRSAYELLKPGGRFVLSTPYHGYLKNVFLAITGKMDQHFTVLWDHGHIKFWSVKTLTAALEEVGFRNVQMRGSGRLPYLWKSMVLSASKPQNIS